MMNTTVEAAYIAAGAALVGVVGTVIVAIVTSLVSHSTNQKTINAAAATTDKTIQAVRETNEASVAADLYSRAVDQLGSSKLDMRIGGIYALERVARDSKGYHPIVMEVLTAFIREYSHERWPPLERQEEGRWTRPDIQAAVTVIGRRDVTRDTRAIDLYHATLINASLSNANLRSAKLRGADLTGVYLYDTILADADLRDATLDGARLNRDDPSRPCRRADLTGVMWSPDKLVPKGWKLNTGSNRLERRAAESPILGHQE
jgi:Pentapeptide repeats (8 copies)